MKNLLRILLILAAAFALLASIFILSSRSLITETTVYEDGAQETTVSQQSWYASQGPWGVAVVLIFATLYFAPYFFYTRDRLTLSALFTLLALALTYLAGFSIGGTYLPAAVVLLLAFFLGGIARFRNL